MAKKPKRTPVRDPKRGSKKRKKSGKTPRIRKDPLKEYDEAMKKDGIVEVLTLSDDDCLANVKMHVSTQSLELDRLLNMMGIPLGRVTEFFGPPHIGKSTLLDHIFAEVQRIGGVGILADTDGARDIRYSQSIGVDPDKLRYLQFDTDKMHVEGVITTLYQSASFWAKNYPDVPVIYGWDALGGTATRDEIKKGLAEDGSSDLDDGKKGKKKSKHTRPAMAAQVMRKACRQLPSKIGNTKIGVVICNHEYVNLQMQGSVGKKKETYGGDGLRGLASIRVQLFPVKDGWVKRSDGAVLGRVVGAKLVKNRLGNPWGEARIALLSGIGINNVWSVLERFRLAKIITGSGSWSALNLDGEVINFQGWSGLMKKCEEDPTLFPRMVSVYKGLL